MGSVFEAKGPSGERVALKMMSAKAASYPEYKEMFDHEVRSLRKLSHNSIVRIMGEPFSDQTGNMYLPMEYIEGQTLSQIIQNPSHGPYSEEEALGIFSQLLDVFSYIHRNACIHRDVKPSNVMIRPDGTVCVIDFGIAKDSRTSTGRTIGRVVGTDGYMSPEQANGLNIDHRTDIYSLGCLLHYMLSGTHAIVKKSNDYETICAILDNDFPLLSSKGISVSKRTQDAILKAVNKNMMLRFQTAEEFRRALMPRTSADQYTITVGRTGCDINMPGEYVSKLHLELLITPRTDTTHVVIRDTSTNGTGVDGRMLKQSSYEFQYSNRSPVFPAVMLSGLPDYTLDWDAVKMVLFDKMGMPTTALPTGGSTVPPPPAPAPAPLPQPDSTAELSIALSIISLVIPLVGWILGSKWRITYPQKAKTANKFAWYGFFLILLDIFLLKL